MSAHGRLAAILDECGSTGSMMCGQRCAMGSPASCSAWLSAGGWMPLYPDFRLPLRAWIGSWSTHWWTLASPCRSANRRLER